MVNRISRFQKPKLNGVDTLLTEKNFGCEKEMDCEHRSRQKYFDEKSFALKILFQIFDQLDFSTIKMTTWAIL